jgi:hypothetical protein
VEDIFVQEGAEAARSGAMRVRVNARAPNILLHAFYSSASPAVPQVLQSHVFSKAVDMSKEQSDVLTYSPVLTVFS